MQSLKKKASKFFKVSSNHAQPQEQDQPGRPFPALPQEDVGSSQTYKNTNTGEEFDAITAADEENANVASNIQLGNDKLTKKPSRYLLRKASTIFAPTTADPLPPPPPLTHTTSSPAVIQTNVAAERASSSPGKRSLRTKASRFFRSNTASSAASLTNKPLPALPSSPRVVAPGFNPRSGAPPPRPDRPGTLDPELMEMMRSSVYRMSLLSGSVSSGSRSAGASLLASSPLASTAVAPPSEFPYVASPTRSARVRDSSYTTLAARMSNGGGVFREVVRKDGIEYYLVRRSSSGTPGTLWRDDRGFLHFVPDV